ncbi:amino acid ABC transporter permease [Herbiconiux moechotypicola]|uniref:Amino acid ABC transporter permease n=1 Tax=Herbiconiux moechotypicola TaxID=637393 RepID=A0ABN3DDD3_9MICO|nr:amino acid ABC transporter permease [Herbiconiux moechotypicola]MCS5729137.1 amino acid ABC transporter permease [Herbiconiux moechotypicola]
MATPTETSQKEHDAWLEQVEKGEPSTLHSRPQPMQWVLGAIAVVVAGFVVVTFANAKIDWPVTFSYVFNPLILEGLSKTIIITVLSFVIGLVLGVVFGTMRLSENKVLAGIAWVYVWIFRGTPLLVQLLLWFNLALILPSIWFPGFGVVSTVAIMTPMMTAIVGLSINEGAYLAEVIRGGILSVDHGQTEAGSALGFSRWRTMRIVILPQAMPAVLPNLGNSAIGLLKTSSLASLVSYPEIVNRAQSLYFVNGRVMEILLVVAFWYLVCTSVMSVGQYYLERHYGRSLTRKTGPVQKLSDRIIHSLLRRRHGDSTAS